MFRLKSAIQSRPLVFLFALVALCPQPARGQSVEELRELTIEDLARVQVTSASKRPEPVSEAPAAIYVITHDDIMRSPAMTLPDLLRSAPNLQIQQINAREYAVSARGFNGFETSNKLLGLIDGRTIYTPLHSGIFWDLHSPLLEDIQQIEVISGPGGTLYGPNAVNGVVSITSKSAFGTQGLLARATAAANERTAALRYGGAIGAGAAFRIYGTYHSRAGEPAGRRGIDDGGEGHHLGFRADFGPEDATITVLGELFDFRARTAAGDGATGHNLLGRWTHSFDAGSVQLRGYYDRFERRFTLVEDSLETVDVEGQFTGDRGPHRVVAGAGVRTTRDAFINRLNGFQLAPSSRRLWLVNFFVQDRLAVTDSLAVVAGAKVERSSFTGLQFLPNVRLAWQPNQATLFWAAVSRAVRTPSRIDRDLEFLPLLAPATGFRSEKLTALEAGYRGQPSASTSLSVSLFYNLYDDIRTTEFSPGGALPIRLANSLSGTTYGLEAWATRQLTPWWRLRIGVATLAKNFEVDEGHVDIAAGSALGNDPDYKLALRSQMSPVEDVDIDVGLRLHDDLERPAVPAYVEAEARIGWRAAEAVELFVAGTNLLHATHRESGEARAQRIERGVHAGARLRF